MMYDNLYSFDRLHGYRIAVEAEDANCYSVCVTFLGKCLLYRTNFTDAEVARQEGIDWVKEKQNEVH